MESLQFRPPSLTRRHCSHNRQLGRFMNRDRVPSGAENKACFSISPGNPTCQTKEKSSRRDRKVGQLRQQKGNMGVYISILQGANPFLLIRKFCRFDNSHHLSSTTGGSQNPHPPSPEIQPSMTSGSHG